MTLLEQPVVVFITGISAAGKSTVADLLAQRFERGVHVKGDLFRRMIVAGREDMTVTPSEDALRQLSLRYRLGASTADAYFRQGFSVVVQDVVLGPDLVNYAKSIRSRPLVVVVLDALVASHRLEGRPIRAARREHAFALHEQHVTHVAAVLEW